MTRRLLPAATAVALLTLTPVAAAGADAPIKVERWRAGHASTGGAGPFASVRDARPAGRVAWRPALRDLRAASTRGVVVRDGGSDEPASFVSANVPFTAFSDADRAAGRGDDFLAEYGEAFGIAQPSTELDLVETERDALGMTHLRYEQRYRGLPVVGHELRLHLGRTAVRAVNGNFAPAIAVPTTPAVAADDAAATAELALADEAAGADASDPDLVVHVDEAGEASLAWRMEVDGDAGEGAWNVTVDAENGIVLEQWSTVREAKDRLVRDAQGRWGTFNQDGTWSVKSVIRRAEGAPVSADNLVNFAYDNTGAVYDYYYTTFGRESYDGFDSQIVSIVHVGKDYANAFWDGRRLAFGDGNRCWRGFSRSVNVVAHEFTHGVVGSEVTLPYVRESGALDESYADVFGTLSELAAGVDDDWVVGDDLAKGAIGCPTEIRDLANPTVGHLSEWRDTVDDNGGVHVNSGIPSLAAVTLAQTPGVTLDDVEQIYYRALTVHLPPSASFDQHRAALVQAATDIRPALVDEVTQALDSVGLDGTPATNTQLVGVAPLTLKTITPAKGESVTVRGRLVDDLGNPIAGRRVQIKTQAGIFLSGKTAADGSWSVRLGSQLWRSIGWRATFPGGGGLAAAASVAGGHIYVRPTLRATTNLRLRNGHFKVSSGKRFLLLGISNPPMYGASVPIQYRWSRNARWRTLGSYPVGGDGRFGVYLSVRAPGSTLWIRHRYDGGKLKPWMDAESKQIAIDIR
jgi:bacillolysin